MMLEGAQWSCPACRNNTYTELGRTEVVCSHCGYHMTTEGFGKPVVHRALSHRHFRAIRARVAMRAQRTRWVADLGPEETFWSKMPASWRQNVQ
jgi:transcription initiation factor TFIIIB Brf1 subunit/transcription initiation factor TFIIB